MKNLYLTINSEKPTIVVFEKPMEIKKLKINKAILSLNYFNIRERAFVKTASSRRDFEPGFWTFKEIVKKLKELNIELKLEEYSQKAILTTPTGSAVSLSGNLRDLLGSNTKTFPQGTTTTLNVPCNILNGLKYFTVGCNELNNEFNCVVRNDTGASVGSNILGLLSLKSFVFVGGTQYHDANDFNAKELINTSYFNTLTFTLSGNNNQPVGEVFIDLLLCAK